MGTDTPPTPLITNQNKSIMEEELNTKNTEIVEDMPDFEETTAEMPCEGEESVTECTDIPENEIVSEETEAETDEETPDSEADTDTEAEKTDEKSAGSAEKKDETKKDDKPKKEGFKSNLPNGLSFNPLVMAIKPFYDKLIAEDEIFANVVKERESRKEKPKSLGECADYIMSEAYNYASKHRNGNYGFAGFPDDDMYRMIRHYYDEEFLEVQKMSGAKAVVSSVSTPKSPAKVEKKKETPKPKANVIDITKAITAKPKADEGKKSKREKKKDNLLAGFVPMERPDAENYEKEGRKGSREQAKSVEQLDMFADFFSE